MKKELVEEWFQRGGHDLDTAEILFEREGHPDIILFHLQQAVEKYLKGFLIYNGWKLKKIHDIETLLTSAIEFEKEFESYLDFGRKLTAFYYEDRYPSGPVSSHPRNEINEMLEITKEIIGEIRDLIMI